MTAVTAVADADRNPECRRHRSETALDTSSNHSHLCDSTEGGSAYLSFLPCGCHCAPPFGWYCVRTNHGQEVLSLQRLRSIGLSVWLPEYEACWSNGQTRIAPLFPRYLFVEFDVSGSLWARIFRQPGVETILTSGGRPAEVPLAAMQALWSQCAPNGVIYRKKPTAQDARIRPGELVEAKAGPFARFRGICQRSSSARVEILLSVFGRETPVVLSRKDVDVVA
ncbi:MAG: transcription termination/antitermination protein NusG [Acetobacteraceae bacterium]